MEPLLEVGEKFSPTERPISRKTKPLFYFLIRIERGQQQPRSNPDSSGSEKRNMRTITFALSASLVLSLSSAALAQTAAGGGSSEGNMNNPASVKSNSEKGMEGSATGGAMGADRMATPGASGGASPATTGAPAGSIGGNGVTGSGAAPSGK